MKVAQVLKIITSERLWLCLLGVAIHIYDHEVTWNESVSDSLDVTQQHTSNQSKA